MKEKPKKRKPHKYKSAESRARQLAGLSGVRIEDHVIGTGIQKVNGMGPLATIDEDTRKKVLDMYMSGMTIDQVQAASGLGRQTVIDIKQTLLDENSQYRDAIFRRSLKDKLQKVIDGTADNLIDRIPEMSGKDLVVALGVATDKYLQIDKDKGPEQLHNHLHIHGVEDISDAMLKAMGGKK